VHLSRAVPSTSNAANTVETTSPIQRYDAHGYSVLDVAVAADNARFASVGGDRLVFLWDVETGNTTRRWSGHGGRIEAVEFGGEGDAVVVSGSPSLCPLDAPIREDSGLIFCICTGSSDTAINLWDARSNNPKPIQSLPEATDTVSSLHVHMPTYSLAAGSYDGRVRVYDLRMGRITVDRLAQAVGSVRCSRDGNAVLVSSLDSRVRVLDRQDGKLLKAFGGEDAASDGVAAGNGNDGGYRNTELRIRSVFAKGDAVVLSGSEAAKDRGGPARMFAWDVLSGEVVASVPAGEGVKAVSCVGWNDKEGCWAGGCSDGMFELIELLRVDGRLWLMD
jgi:mitogen-activated protein kinase organizer 1